MSKRLVCLFRGHRIVRVITAVQLEPGIGGLVGRITGQRFDCLRCARKGVKAR